MFILIVGEMCGAHSTLPTMVEFIVFCFILTGSVTSDIHSCGGFVKSSVPVDYSKIKCGRWIPVLFSLNILTNTMINLLSFKMYSIDDLYISLYMQTEINIGFLIDGIVDSGYGNGPAGLPLILTQSGKIIDTTTTTNGGKYMFKAVSGVVKDGPVKVQPDLRIAGYQLIITVTHKDHPFSNALIIIYAAVKPELNNCVSVESPVDGVPNAKYACSVGKTLSDGTITVPCMPHGEYFVKAQYNDGDITFQFSPVVLPLSIKDRKNEVFFSVTGFSARGRVVVGEKGFAGASVFIDGKLADTTDASGYYVIKELKVKRIFVLMMEFVYFIFLQEGPLIITATALNTKFSSKRVTLTLPNIIIPDLAVEGFEMCGSVEKSVDEAAPMALAVRRKDSSETILIHPDLDGKFCKMISPGLYIISPSDVSSSLTPRLLDVNLSYGPVKNLRFTNFKTDVKVRVTCLAFIVYLGTCGPLSISLLLGDTIVQTVHGKDEFVFSDIGPGHYKARIVNGGRACWENRDIDVVVERIRPQPVHFVQNGIVTDFILSHPATLVHIFIIFLELKIKVIFISSRSGAGERQIPVSGGVFSFLEPLTSSGDIIIIPHSLTHLFIPASYSLRFRGECVTNAVEFTAIKGIFIDGSISPAVEGVKISATHKNDVNLKFEAFSNKTGHFRIGPVRSAEDISISARLDGYSFSEQDKKVGRLISVKLSKLTVIVSDSANSGRLDDVLLSLVGGNGYRTNSMIKENGEINFVGLVCLSINIYLLAAPGDYYLRAILQEYKFEPSTTAITIKEGEHEHVELSGKRVAYSIFGRIREMSGAVVPDVIVEALSEQCDQHQSEVATAVDGSFRIRGLKPHCQYKVSVKSNVEGKAAPHCFPSQFEVQMTADDVKGLEMVAAPYDRTTDVAVEMDFGSMSMPQSYRVSVHRNGETISQAIVFSPVNVFYVSNLSRDGSEYSVRVESDKPPQAFPAKTMFFTADAPVRVVRVPITSSRRTGDVEISIGQMVVLLLFAMGAAIYFNQLTDYRALPLIKQEVFGLAC
uniref:Nodal modulator 1 n=1 Tax=Heterorhabditis bacteriophora TaxID=37862 RepID=A0A1I7XJG5_HETBA